ALIPAAYKFGFSYKPYIDVTDNSLKQIVGLIIPIFIGQTVFQLNTVVDKSLASNLPTGTVTALNYAFKLNDFFVSILIMSIATVIYPKLNKYAAEDNIKALKHTLYVSLARPSVVLMPCMVGVMVLAHPIVKVLYGRGAFDAEDVELTSQCLVFYSVGMVTVGFRQILNKVFYSLRDSKTPMINGAIAVVLNIVLNLIFIGPLQHKGLALATSISSLLTVILLFANLRKKIGRLGIMGLLVNLFKMFVSALVMGFVIYFVNAKLTDVMPDTLLFTILNLVITTVVGMIVYFIGVMILGVKSAPPKKQVKR
ncbi:MAG: polysaccharide biosynthesis C-terminal domain-containing protein, partial [Oscillospiraceae bacterium]|nr:polysaccharide biosynthesis C-terminal domain-containing protein [Oscillospiraceae bacterium]